MNNNHEWSNALLRQNKYKCTKFYIKSMKKISEHEHIYELTTKCDSVDKILESFDKDAIEKAYNIIKDKSN
jgi:hypothetical protein